MCKIIQCSLIFVFFQAFVINIKDVNKQSFVLIGGYNKCSQQNRTVKGLQCEEWERAVLSTQLKEVVDCDDTFTKYFRPKEFTNKKLIDYQYTTLRQTSTIPNGDKVDMDEDILLTFDEKARKDGFKITTPEENPYAVLLVTRDDSKEFLMICTGTLLTTKWVLSAAHCFNHVFRDLIVYAGGNSLDELIYEKYAEKSQRRITTNYKKHPMYSKKYLSQFDVAVVKVDRAFEISDTVNTSLLSSRVWSYPQYKACKLTGFGDVQIGDPNPEDKKRKTHYLEVKSPCKCFEDYSLFRKLWICSRPKEDYGVCSGDSGAGLICEGKVVAVAMAVLPVKNLRSCNLNQPLNERCGVKNTLSIFQQTCPYLKWINSYVQLFNETEIDPKCKEPKPVRFPMGAVDMLQPNLTEVVLLTLLFIIF